MTTNLWQGGTISLRAIEIDDWKAFHEDSKDTESARNYDVTTFPLSTFYSKEYCEKSAAKNGKNDEYRFVIETPSNEIVGSFETYDCDKRMGTFFFGMNIFAKHRRKGYAKEAIALVLRFYFAELRYQKATVFIDEFNQASIELHKKIGFIEEGKLRRMIFTNNQFYDRYYLGMTKEEWLKSELFK